MGQGGIKVKKMRSVPIYIILGLLCAALMFPVYIAVILPFQASDELSQTITPLIKNVEEYIRIDFAAQYPTLEHFSGLLLYTPEFYTVFWNSLLMAVRSRDHQGHRYGTLQSRLLCQNKRRG